jgi:hypothetical protein
VLEGLDVHPEILTGSFIAQSTLTLTSVSRSNCQERQVACLTHHDILSLISPVYLHGFGLHWEQAVAH